MRQLSQTELSARAHVPAAMISHFETGVRANASAENLTKLADALDVSIDYLLGRADDPNAQGSPVEAALFRALEGAPTSVRDSVVRIAQALAQQERDRRPPT